jgi:hypothetical protein
VKRKVTVPVGNSGIGTRYRICVLLINVPLGARSTRGRRAMSYAFEGGLIGKQRCRSPEQAHGRRS